jgi:hypothetical protein
VYFQPALRSSSIRSRASGATIRPGLFVRNLMHLMSLVQEVAFERLARFLL